MKRLLLVGVLVGACVATTGAIAAASGNAGSATQVTSAARSHRDAPLPPFGLPTESKLTAITPCRAVDTRSHGGAFGNGTQRTYSLAGCDVPSDATGVSATITTVATHGGYLKAWAAGASEPATSFMNYGTAFNASTGGLIPVSGGAIDIKNHAGPTQVIIDITGYYLAPMAARVDSGTLRLASRVTGVSTIATGAYEVDFDRDVRTCAYNVTATNSVIALAQPRSGASNGVFVATTNSSGSAVSADFYLTVTC